MNWSDKKFSLNYHVDSNGNLIPLCSLLNCYDQNCYFELRKVTKFRPWIFFCDDINPYIKECGEIGIHYTGIKYQYISERTWSIENNYFDKISDIIKDNGEVMLGTAFNFVPEYCWSEEGRDHLHIGHYSYLLDEDKEYYYVADTPSVFLNIENIRTQQNPSVLYLVKSHFTDAFRQYCKVKKIWIKESLFLQNEYSYFIRNIKEMIKYYEMSEEEVIVGRAVLTYLIEKCKQKEDDIFKSLFSFHLIISRRIILKRCIQSMEKEIGDCKKILLYLNKSIEYWTIIKKFSFECLYNNQAVGMEAIPAIEALLDYEDKLMQSIEETVKF